MPGRRSRPQERFPDVERLINDWPDEAFDAIDLGPNDAVAVLSHDAEVRRAGDRRGAPARRSLRRRRRLAQDPGRSARARSARRASTTTDLARLHGPIGLDLGGRAPAETALSIMAEIVADRYGGSGRPMIEKARRERRPRPSRPSPAAG